MAQRVDFSRLRDELVDAVKKGDENRARSLMPRLGAGPRHIRTVLEAMLEDPAGLVRQAAAFALGELGGAASARRLERQLSIEEAGGNYDGAAVAEEITRALGRIKGEAARVSLVRRLERVTAGKLQRSDADELALALWRKRHPELLQVVARSLEQLGEPKPNALLGLLLLLERTPEELRAWAIDPAVPVSHKTAVLTVLKDELPDEWISTLPAFITAAHVLVAQAVHGHDEAAYFCEDLLSTVLLHRARLLGVLPEQARSELRDASRRLVGAESMGCALRAAAVLKYVGRPEDAAILEAHQPADPTFTKVFNDTVRALRGLQKN
jgi:hypothetical protein